MKPLLLFGLLLVNYIALVSRVTFIWQLIMNILIVLIIFSSFYILRHRRTLQLLQLTTTEILANEAFSVILSKTEKRIEQLFNCSSVILFWQHNVAVVDWKKGYYQFALQENDLIDRGLPARITIDTVYGEQAVFYYYPITQGDDHFGSILIPLRRFQKVTRITKWFLKQISILMIDQFHQLQAKSALEVSVLQDLQKKVAQDMHDGIAQKLFFLSAQVFSIKNELRPRFTDAELARMKKLAEHVDESLVEVRNYMFHLRDSDWQNDLFQELKQMLHEKSVTTGLEVHLNTTGTAINESFDVLKAIYHLVDESTTNVIKHANATKIDVALEVTPIQWSIKIADDGIGINEALRKRKSDRLGLLGIEERIKHVGGFLSIRSRDGAGTELISIIPRIKNGERGSIIGV